MINNLGKKNVLLTRRNDKKQTWPLLSSDPIRSPTCQRFDIVRSRCESQYRDITLIIHLSSLDRQNAPAGVVGPRKSGYFGDRVNMTLNNQRFEGKGTNPHCFVAFLASRCNWKKEIYFGYYFITLKYTETYRELLGYTRTYRDIQGHTGTFKDI